MSEHRIKIHWRFSSLQIVLAMIVVGYVISISSNSISAFCQLIEENDTYQQLDGEGRREFWVKNQQELIAHLRNTNPAPIYAPGFFFMLDRNGLKYLNWLHSVLIIVFFFLMDWLLLTSCGRRDLRSLLLLFYSICFPILMVLKFGEQDIKMFRFFYDFLIVIVKSPLPSLFLLFFGTALREV